MRDLLAPFRITNGRHFKLRHHDPGDTGRIKSKTEAADLLAKGLESLREQQEKLYAQGTWALLLIIQAMDAAGKDSIVEHVMSGVNPQGCHVSAFKSPSAEELGHDYLWRTAVRLPSRGQIGVFNRSYYEEVLVVRVHPEILARQRLPHDALHGDIWKRRFRAINDWERHLTENGFHIVKLFLN